MKKLKLEELNIESFSTAGLNDNGKTINGGVISHVLIHILVHSAVHITLEACTETIYSLPNCKAPVPVDSGGYAFCTRNNNCLERTLGPAC